MADTASLIVRIVTEKKGDAGKELTGTAAKVDGVSKKFAKFAVPAAAAGAAVLAFGASAVKSASRTQQAMGAVDSVFGKNAAQIKKWAAGSAESVGLASSQYAELATVLGSQLKNMGIPLDQVAGKTDELIRLGADLAATYGGTTAEAVEALSSTLRGETDPIERYGVSINQAAIAAKQAEDGTAGLEGAAGKQAKTMATLALVSQQTADAQGQFAEESGSAAGQAQIASARYEDMKSALGTALLPAVAAVTGVLGGLAEVVGKHPKLAQAAAAAILAMSVAVLALVAATKVYQAALIAVEMVQKATWLSNPIFLVIAAVILLVAAIVILWKRSETFRRVVLAMWSAIRAAAGAVARAVKATWQAVFNALSVYVRGYLAVVRAVFSTVRAVAGAVAAGVRAVFNNAFSAIRTAARAVGAAIRSAWDGITGAVGRVANAIRSSMINAFDAIKRAASGISSALSSPFNAVKNAINSLIAAVKSLIGWLGRIKVPKISLPKIPGLRSLASAAPAAASGAVTAAGARIAVPMASAPTVAAGGAGIVINITGAIDPESTARQIRRVLTGSAIRHSAAGSARGLRTA